MKITKSQLKQIIKEELKKALSEACGDDPMQHLADQLGIDVVALEDAIEQMGLSVVSAQDLATGPEEEYDARWANRAPEYEEEMPPLEEKKKKKDDKWMQKAVDPEHEGYCTPMTKKTCTPKRKALAKRFKKAAKKKEKKGGTGWQGKV